MRLPVLTAVLGLLAAMPAAAQGSRHSAVVAGLQDRFAPLVKTVGRDLVIFDADGLVRPFGDAVMGRTWDRVPKGARGSFERISEATGERRAFSMIVRVGDRAQCRVGPTSPDQAAMNLLSAYSGHDRQVLNPAVLKLTSTVFQRFVLLHEIGHCTDPDAFARSQDPIRNAMMRHRAEAYGDAFAILQLAKEGVPADVLEDIVRIRALYMLASATGTAGGSDVEMLRREHVPYWNVTAMRAAIASAPNLAGSDDRAVASLAHAIVDNDGMTTARLVRINRALAGESPDEEVQAYTSDASSLISPATKPPKEATFDKEAWDREFEAKLAKAGASGSGPVGLIALERDRLRALAGQDWNADDAVAIEGALARLAELATKGYASVSDPPMTVSSRGGLQKPSVAAMPSRIDSPGPMPKAAETDDAAVARSSPYPAAKPAPAPVAARPAARSVARAPLPKPKVREAAIAPVPAPVARLADATAGMTGISPVMARDRGAKLGPQAEPERIRRY